MQTATAGAGAVSGAISAANYQQRANYQQQQRAPFLGILNGWGCFFILSSAATFSGSAAKETGTATDEETARPRLGHPERLQRSERMKQERKNGAGYQQQRPRLGLFLGKGSAPAGTGAEKRRNSLTHRHIAHGATKVTQTRRSKGGGGQL